VITDDTQRWLLGRDVRRPAGEPIRTAEYDVAPIATAAEAIAFVRTHHYAGSPSPAAHRFGIYHRGELAGVALFGPPASTNAHNSVWGHTALTQKQAVTLGRFVLLDTVPDYGESWFIARCFDLLRGRGVIAVESCADPQPRLDACGVPVFRGHLGTIYQATNGRFVGRTNDSTLHLLPDSTCLSNRSQSKLRKGERGDRHPVAQLVTWGATEPRNDEDIGEWLATWRSRLCTTMRHRGCYRYLWCINRRWRRRVLTAPALAYPKNEGWRTGDGS
jgi:hypothetical protein